MDIASRYQTKTQLVYEFLREAIVSGELEPGAHLVTSQLARRFGVSDIPVREALIRLDAEGLVTRYSNTRTVVTHLDLDELMELLLIREVLEALAARLAAERAGRSLEGPLQRMIRKMEEAADRADSQRYGKLNREFHEAIYEYGGRHLFAMIRNLWDQTERSRTVFRLMPERMRESLEEHRRIAAAITAGDGELSERLVREHRQAVIGSIRQVWKAGRAANPRGSSEDGRKDVEA